MQHAWRWGKMSGLQACRHDTVHSAFCAGRIDAFQPIPDAVPASFQVGVTMAPVAQARIGIKTSCRDHDALANACVVGRTRPALHAEPPNNTGRKCEPTPLLFPRKPFEIFCRAGRE
jgi:hypothetical protein